MPQSLLRKILNVEHAEDFTGHYVHVSAKHVKSLRDTIIFNFQKFLSIKSESNAIFTHPREDDFGRMKTNMFLSFRLNSRDVTAPPFQVYGGSSYKEGFINKCFNGSVFSMLCLEVKANTSHLLAPKVDRSFGGDTKGIADNASDMVGEFSLHYLRRGATKNLCWTIGNWLKRLSTNYTIPT